MASKKNPPKDEADKERQTVTDETALTNAGTTARHLVNAGIRAHKVNKVHEGQPHVVDSMINGVIDLMLNSTEGPQSVVDSFNLRRAALQNKIPYYTTISGAKAAVDAIASLKVSGTYDVKSLQEYLAA